MELREPISRADAIASGLRRYFTGAPCGRGHISERAVSDHSCLACKNENRKDYVRRYPERVVTANRKQYLKNRDANITRSAERAKQFPEENRARARAYYAKNPEKYAVHSRNRKARLKNAEGRHTADDVKALFDRQKGRCVNCCASIRDSFHVDHIMPLIRGGSNGPENIQLLCPPCNLSKKAKDPIDWAQQNGRLL